MEKNESSTYNRKLGKFSGKKKETILNAHDCLSQPILCAIRLKGDKTLTPFCSWLSVAQGVGGGSRVGELLS